MSNAHTSIDPITLSVVRGARAALNASQSYFEEQKLCDY